MKRLLALTAMTVLGVALSTPAAMADDADTTTSAPETGTALEKISAYVQPSVVYLHMHWKGYVWDKARKEYVNSGLPFEVDTQCTGYVVNPDGYIATAGHCVDPKGDIYRTIAQQAAQFQIDNGMYDASITVEDLVPVLRVEGYETTNRGPDRVVKAAWGVSAGGLQTGRSYTARVVKYQPFDRGDAAVLKVEASDLQAIAVADDSPLDIGTEIVSIGYPASVDLVTDQSFSPSFKDGTVSSSKTIQDGLLTVYEISAAVSGGMSGGPTVDLDGNVVGFNSFGIDSTIESQQFNFVRPTSIINELMADVGVDNELGELSENYRAGLDAYFAGDKDGAIESLTLVLDSQPTNAMAADYLKKAKAMEEPEAPGSDSDSGFPVVPVAIGGVVVLLLAAGGVLLMVRRRPGRGVGGATPAVPSGPAPSPAGGWSPQPTTSAPGVSAVSADPAAPAAPVPAVPAGPAAAAAPVTTQTASAPQAASTAAPVGASAAPAPAAPPAPAQPAPAETVGFRAGSPDPASTNGQPGAQEPAAAEPQRAVFCTSCGTRAVPGQKFCGGCGTAL